jgi:aspartyl-tRNA(Asn)/glutamyl-tRNA(Gln) amidotransferase subunit B
VEYGIPPYDAGVLTQSAALADYFEGTARAAKNAKAASNWIMGELLRTLNERGHEISDVPIRPAALAGLIALIDKGTISSSIAKGVFAKMYDSGRSADDIVREEGLAQNSDEGALAAIVAEVIKLNDETARQYRAGKKQTFGFLVGQVMKASGGKANPKLASDLVRRALES